jgi:hypothetical protein
MRLGLSLALGGQQRSSGAAFDPASLALTGWWEDYAGTTWVGKASAGTSGGRTLVASGLAPDVGTAINGHGTAQFDGSSQALFIDAALSTFVAAGAGTVVYLARSAVAGDGDPGGATRYTGSAVVCDDPAAGYFHVGSNNGGCYGSIFDGSYKSSIGVGATQNTWVLGAARWNGTTISARRNNGAWHGPIACGTIDDLAADLYIGNGFGADRYNGLIGAILTIDQHLDDATLDSILAYYRSFSGEALS